MVRRVFGLYLLRSITEELRDLRSLHLRILTKKKMTMRTYINVVLLVVNLIPLWTTETF